MKRNPQFCRPEAYHFFADQLPQLETTTGLLNSALAIAMHAFDDVYPEVVEMRLMSIAARARDQFQGNQVQAMLAHLHHVLFDEERFMGNHLNYYQPLNSYLPAVLESRRGIPVTLSLVYKVVGEYIGLHVEGVNTPGHFLVRVRGREDWIIIDPYYGGTVLSQNEAFERIELVTQQRVVRHHSTLAAATHRQWIARVLANLRLIFSLQGRRDDLGAMNELYGLLADE